MIRSWLILICCAGLFLISCEENKNAQIVSSNIDKVLERRDTSEFEKFINFLPELQLPIIIDGCELMFDMLNRPLFPDKNEFPSFYTEAGAYLGKITNKNFITIVFLGGADCYLPVLQTYSLKGEKISSGDVHMGYCGGGPCYKCSERLTIKQDLSFSVIDSSFIYNCNEETYERVDSSEVINTSWIDGHITEKGQVVVGKMHGENAVREFSWYLKSLDTIPIPFTHYSLESATTFSPNFDSIDYQRYKHSWGFAPSGIVSRTDSIIVVMELVAADISVVPLLVSYNMEGVKIDSLSFYTSSGYDAGYKGVEYLRLEKDYAYIVDTVFWWDPEIGKEGEADLTTGNRTIRFTKDGTFIELENTMNFSLNKGLDSILVAVNPLRGQFKSGENELNISPRGSRLIYVNLSVASQTCAMPNFEGFLHLDSDSTYSGLISDFNRESHPVKLSFKEDQVVLESHDPHGKWHLGMNCTVEGKYQKTE